MRLTLKGWLSAALFAAIVAAPSLASAQLGATAGTNIVYAMTVVTNNAWGRSVVTELLTTHGVELLDRREAFVSAANLAALGVSVKDAHRVSDAWMRGFAQGTNVLSEAMSNYVARGGTFMKITYPLVPSSTRRSVDVFVVSNTYDSVRNRDCLWLYFSRELPMKPSMSLPYVSESGFTTNRVAGTFSVPDVAGSHWTNAVTITRFRDGLDNPIAYEKCHPCWFSRPAALRGVPIFLYRHGSFGSRESGLEWGSLAVTVDGTPTITGEVTNAVEGTVAVFSNGGFTGTYRLEDE